MKTLITFLVFFVLLTPQVFAQFDSLIFKKHIYIDRLRNDLYPLGDQNGDGYDDFMIYDCFEGKAKIFFGGNPIDTIPVMEISCPDPGALYFAVIDLNDDGVKDIVITNSRVSPIGNLTRVYYGGSFLDTIPNISFNAPEGATVLTNPVVLKDYNGDGREELVFYDGNLPYTEKQFGTFYFYNTGAVFDTIPEYILMGDSVTGKRFNHFYGSNEDIDGDGKADFTAFGSFNGKDFREFYKGNENFDLTPEIVFKKNEHTFQLDWMKLIKNVTGGQNAQILTTDYNNTYPFYYINTIWNGSFPIDTIPDIGINTQNQGLIIPMTFVNDFNGDGYNDLLGRTGAAQVKLWLGGNTFTEVAVKTWGSHSVDFAITALRDIGDIDGDGVQDIAIGLGSAIGNEPCGRMGIVYIFKGDTSVKGDTTTGIGLLSPEQPKDYYLEEPYPNPFNSETKIIYVTKALCKVEITMYDVLGKEKGVLLNEEKEAGVYHLSINAEKLKLTSGVYFIKAKFIQSNNTVIQQTKKIIYLK